MSKSHSFVQLW